MFRTYEEQIRFFNELNLGSAKDRAKDRYNLKLTDMFNEEYTKFRKSINGDVDYYNNSQKDSSNELIQKFAFESIPRTQGIAGIFIKPSSLVSFSQLHQASLDSVVGTELQHLRSYLLENFREYSHKNKDFEKLVKKTMFSCEWDTKFLYACSDFLKTGSACGEKIWGYDKDTKQYYISKIVFAPSTNLQYMANFTGDVIGAIQPNVFADTQGLFNNDEFGQRQSEFGIREYIGAQLPYVIVEKKDLFYTGIENVFDPYGISPVRRSYQYFQNKQLVLSMLMTASAKNSSPYMFGIFDKNTLNNQQQIEEVTDGLASLSVGDTAVLPSGIDIKAIDVNKGSLDSLLNVIKYLDSQQIMSMYGLGQGDSFSDSEFATHQAKSTLSLFKNAMRSAINRDIIIPLAEHNNYPEVYKDLDFGEFLGKRGTLEDQIKQSAILNEAISNGLVDVKSKDICNELLYSLGLPESNKSIEDNIQVIIPPKNTSNDNRDLNGSKFSHSDGVVHNGRKQNKTV